MKKYEEYYFKAGHGLISGIDIGFEKPVKDAEFLSCDFHPNTFDCKFTRCVFINCNVREEDLTNAVDCAFFQF